MRTSSDFWIGPDEHDPRDLTFRPVPVSTARSLTASQVEAFNRDGILGPLPALHAEETADLRAYIDWLLDEVIGADDRRNSYSVNAYHMVCARLHDLVLHQRILDYVEDILGPDFVCWGTQLFCKLGGDPKEIPLHQDAPYWPFDTTHSVTVWLAIDDVDADNAAMELVTGSHLLGPVNHLEMDLDGTRVLRRGAERPERFTDRFTDAMRAGELSLHTDLTLHGSPPNLSPRRRAGFTMRYTAAHVRPLPGYESWARPAIHCRGKIPAHWNNWRRPDGEHPEKMAAFTGTFDGNPPDAG